MSERARILVLVGPKGSGKTTLGELLEAEPSAHFLEGEAIAKRVLAEAWA
jgi:shikimate kinase